VRSKSIFILLFSIFNCAELLFAQAPLIQWEQSFGGSNDDGGTDVLQNSDGTFMIAAFTKSVDGDVTGNHGNTDAWVLIFRRKFTS